MEWLSNLSNFLGIAGVVSGILATAAYGRSKLTAQLWKEEAAVQEKRYITTKEELGNEKTRAEKELAAEIARSKVLSERTRGVEDQLTRLVTQQPAIEKLATTVTKQHTEMMGRMTEMMEKLSNLAVELSNVAKAITKSSETSDARQENREIRQEKQDDRNEIRNQKLDDRSSE